MPTREVYWNISHIWIMYALLVPTMAIFGYGIYRRYRLWMIGGRDGERLGNVRQRLTALVVYVLGHRRMLREAYSGWFHFFLFSGFIILFIGTLVVAVHADFNIPIMQGDFYLYFQSFILDVFGLLAILGILMLGAKRYLARPARLHANIPEREGARRQIGWQDGGLLALVGSILVTGFLIEGLRIAATDDPWSEWSPVGAALGRWFEAGFGLEGMKSAHAFLWWFHLALVYGFTAWLPYTKLLHIFTSTANIYARSLEPVGAMLKPIDMETAERLGVAQLEDLSWKDLLDLDACTECGRCQAECPATATGKPLSPKTLVLDLREALHRRSPGKPASDNDKLVPAFVHEDTLWACTTCMACMHACPVMIEHVPKIIGMRRYLAMEEASVPDLMAEALKSLEDRGHPFRGTTSSRSDWYRDLPVKHISEASEPEYILWVGCASSLNERNKQVLESLARLLTLADVNFAVLGSDERCTGDPARRIGNEYLFEQMARENIAKLEALNIKKIVTPCPHCLNCFRHEYPQFGGDFEVVHHSQLLSELIRSGRLKPDQAIDKTMTYHDPCYLGRYNSTYDAPREVVGACGQKGLKEMEKSRESSFCCGGGGGNMWAEELGTRVNNERSEQALKTGAEVIAVSCPFCLIMMEDGVKAVAGEKPVEVLDIAEVLDRSMGKRMDLPSSQKVPLAESE